MTSTDTQDRTLEGKVAIVTGAGGAIGRACATLLANLGARVVVNDLGTDVGGGGSDRGPAETVANEIRAAGGEAIANTDSVSQWDSARRVVEAAMDTWGQLDIVVNNAGNVRYSTFHESDPEDVRALNDVHYFGTYYISRAAAPHFVAQKSGSYIHMTSSTALIGMKGNAGYTAAKLGVVGMSRAIALDMAEFNVRSNCVAPAANSRMSPKRASAEAEAAHKAKVRPEQVAPLVAFLASDRSTEISGQIMGVRGNELFLYSQPRPVRVLHRETGWDVAALEAQMLPAWRATLTPLEETYQVFGWPAQ